MTKLFLLITLSLTTGLLPTKTPAAKKFFSALQKELGAGLKKVEQKLPKLAKQGLAKSKNLLGKVAQQFIKVAAELTKPGVIDFPTPHTTTQIPMMTKSPITTKNPNPTPKNPKTPT